MHQLHRTRNGTECGKCPEKFPAAQALRYQFPADCNADIYRVLFVYPCGFAYFAAGAQTSSYSGVSYEFIRLAGRYDNRLVNILSKPGLWMQKMTTKEPDDEMIEVGIASVEAVFDWRKWQKEENV